MSTNVFCEDLLQNRTSRPLEVNPGRKTDFWQGSKPLEVKGLQRSEFWVKNRTFSTDFVKELIPLPDTRRPEILVGQKFSSFAGHSRRQHITCPHSVSRPTCQPRPRGHLVVSQAHVSSAPRVITSSHFGHHTLPWSLHLVKPSHFRLSG